MKNNLLLTEITEHLNNINNIINDISSNINDTNFINDFFRSIHTIKGNSLSGGFTNLSRISHKLEEILDKLRNNKIQPTPALIDLILETSDTVFSIFDYIKDNGNDNYPVSDIIEKVDLFLQPFETSLEKITYDTFNLSLADIQNSQLKLDDNLYKLNITISEEVFIVAVSMYKIFKFLNNDTPVIKSFPSDNELVNDDIPDDEFSNNYFLILKFNDSSDNFEKYLNKLKKHFSDDIEDIMFEKIDLQPLFVKQQKTLAAQKIKTDNFIRVDISQLNHLLAILQNFVIIKNRFEDKLKSTDDYSLKELLSQFRLNTNTLNYTVMDIRLMQMSYVLSRFPSLIRKLCRQLNKNVELKIEGDNTKIDRAILDVIGDPLVHIIRNCLDHGIETPDNRIKAGKPEKGNIIIKIDKINNMLQINIIDDGQGINISKVKEKAVEKKIISVEQAAGLSDEQALELIMKPGFSTAENVTDVSGRGVGMDVVKDTINKLRGNILLKSEQGKGTHIKITLPSSISITSCLVCSIDNYKFLLPVQSVFEIIEISPNDLISDNNIYYADLSNRKILNKIFLTKIKILFLFDYKPNDNFYILLLKNDDNMIMALAIEKIINQLDLIIKPLNRYFLNNINLFNGAALLGDNTPALAIDTHYLFMLF